MFSKPAKKCSLSFTTGPPSSAVIVSIFVSGRLSSVFGCEKKNGYALNALRRKRYEPEPCTVLVPDGVIAL